LPNSTGYTRGKNPNSHRNKPKVKAGEITVRLTQPALDYLAQFKNKTQVVEDLILAAAVKAELQKNIPDTDINVSNEGTIEIREQEKSS
jgi:hypothetical protein